MSANPKLTESSDSVATAPANDADSTHLIVADGHAKMRTYLARSLQPLGTVEAVADGYQALASVYRRIPDLVLSDEKTPKLDGFALLRNLREDDRTKALPIVLLSARAGERARLKAAIAGANDYIVKPFSSRELVARIDAQLQIARQRRAYAEAVRSSQEWQKRLEQLRQGQKELEKSLNAMRRMQTLGSLFLREGNLQSILVETVEVAIAISGADFGNLQVLDPQSSKLTIAAQHGFPDWWLDFWSNVGNGEGACGIALEFGKRVIVEDVARSPIFDGRSLEIQLKAGVRAVQSTPLVSRSGKLLGIFSTHYRNPGRPDERSLARLDMLAMQAADIIERARAEEALKLANAQLIEADRHKNQFLAVLSHELRNPLAPIKNSLLVLDQAVFVSDEAQRARSVIVRQTEQLSRLVDDLLDVTRITRNKVRLQRERLDLNELVRRTTDDHRSLFENNGIRIEFSATDKPADVSADSNRLAQVLGNLLQNAAMFTHRGGIVSVSL